MPELPEVETVVRDLRPILVGAFLKDVSPAVENLKEALDVAVVAVSRRGKFINISFDNGQVMTIHLRMTGRLIVQDHNDPELKYERTRIDFDQCSLRFCDLRRFGKIWINDLKNFEEKTGIFKLGVEPLDGEFSVVKFAQLLSKRRGPIKKWLLDQTLVAGIGNIYADEACFYAKIRPDAMVEDLSAEDLERLHEAVVRALEQGIRNRGTSVSDYADAYGKSGKNQELLYVYGRGGKPCMECEQALVKVKLVGRGTVYCESCQK